MIGGKWISDLSGDTPVDAAAQRVLAVRLEAVRDALAPALRNVGEDTEHIHLLRVVTRRAESALEIFGDWLPAKNLDAARKHLRRIRRAAGKARDWDVLLSRLFDELPRRAAEDQAALHFLIGHAAAQRLPAQRDLETACPDYPFAFQRFLATTLAKIRRPKTAGTRLDELGLQRLQELLDELDRAAQRDFRDYEALHAVRIVGKRLRYAMEVFIDCFAAPLRKQIYPAVAEMQEILGQLNDACVAVERYRRLQTQMQSVLPPNGPNYQPLLTQLIAEYELVLPAQRRRFEQWWQHWRQPELRLAVADLLQAAPRPAAAPTAVEEELPPRRSDPLQVCRSA